MKILHIIGKELKKDYKSILIFTALMSIFFMWFVSFFDPEMLAGLEEAFEAYPEAIRLMVGEFASLGEFGGFINIYLFSISWFYFGIYFILKSAQNIPKEIDFKTIDIVLSKPITRTEFTLGKYFSFLIEMLFIFYGITVSVLLGIMIFPTATVTPIFLNEILFAFLWSYIFMVALISTGYFFSTFLSSKRALAFGFGVVIFFYAVGQFWKAFPEGAQEIKRISIFFYSDMSNLLVNHIWDNVGLHIAILLTYSVVLIISAVIIFNKRDIPV